ncbi:MAG: FRG domain-containing protein [Myxococcales bacterium]|nr:FRG domain-containing protein [Myxococcales bacterium]
MGTTTATRRRTAPKERPGFLMQEARFPDVEAFITHIEALKGMAGGHKWAFRGQRDATWALLPSAFRKGAELGYSHAPKIVGEVPTNREQAEAEFLRLREFLLAVDGTGLAIPEDTQALRAPRGWNELHEEFEGVGFPSHRVLSMLALGQHYGVPTRLLDFSERWEVALYFAVVDAVGAPPVELAVYALDLDWVLWRGFRRRGGALPAVQVVSAPRSSNPNLNAQAGLFLAPSIFPSQHDRAADLAPLDVRLARLTEPGTVPVLWKLVLPSACAGRALRLLSMRGVNHATLFPGFAGAAQFLKERKKWDIPRARWTPWTPE